MACWKRRSCASVFICVVLATCRTLVENSKKNDAEIEDFTQVPVISMENIKYGYEDFSLMPTNLGGRRGVNVTDVVYKSALRFLRCSAIPDNPHGIDLLDPLVFNWDQLTHRQTIRLDGTINGTETQLSEMNINYVSIGIISLSAVFRAVLPRLSISGTYNVTGVLANTLPIFGSGPYSIEASNVSLAVTAILGINMTGGLSMSNFTVDLSPESVKVSLGELLGGGPLGAVLQDFIQDASLQIVDRGRALIQENLREVVIPAANRHLARLAGVQGLVTFLVNFGNVTDTC